MYHVSARKMRRAGLRRSEKRVASERPGTINRSALVTSEDGNSRAHFHATKGWRFLPKSEPRRARRLAAVSA